MRGVDTPGEEPREPYRPERSKGEANPHVKKHWGSFILGAFICWAIWGIGQGLFFYWLGTDDPWATLRMIDEKIMTVVPGFTCGWAAVLFVDAVTFGNLIKGIINGVVACAILASVVFLGTILLYLRIIL